MKYRMSWVDAIKKFSEQSKTKFAIPKRDSPEYAAIRAIQETMAKGEGAAPKKVVKKKVVPVAPAPVAAPAPAPVKKVKMAKKENVDVPVVAPEPAPEVKVVKKRKMMAKPAEKPEVVEAAPEPVKEVKKPKAPKAPKRENQEPEPTPEPAPEVKVAPLSVQQEREAKRAAKQLRLEEQSKKGAEFALAQARMAMSKMPIVLDFS